MSSNARHTMKEANECRKLKALGYSYREIAVLTDLPLTTVKIVTPDSWKPFVAKVKKKYKTQATHANLGVAHRCRGCGGKVYGRCLLCKTRGHIAKHGKVEWGE